MGESKVQAQRRWTEFVQTARTSLTSWKHRCLLRFACSCVSPFPLLFLETRWLTFPMKSSWLWALTLFCTAVAGSWNLLEPFFSALKQTSSVCTDWWQHFLPTISSTSARARNANTKTHKGCVSGSQSICLHPAEQGTLKVNRRSQREQSEDEPTLQ